MKKDQYFNKISKTWILLICLLLVLLIGFIDYLTGVQVSLSVLYLMPIAIITWKVGKKAALFFAFISAIICALSNGLLHTNTQSADLVILWNTLVRFLFFLIVVLLLDRLIVYQESLENIIKLRTTELRNEIEARKNAEDELNKKTEKLRLLAKRMQLIRDEENVKIAREIHDELGQALTAIKIETISLSKKYANYKDIVDRLFIITDMVDDVIKSIRKISTRLRPRLLDELGLIPAVEWHLKDVQNRTGIYYELEFSDESFNLNQNASINLFRIFQEAITNIIRHSRATKITVNIFTNSNDDLIMEVMDNGLGLPEGYLDKTNSVGIIGMKERAHMLNGSLEVQPGEHIGTKVTAIIPLNSNIKQDDKIIHSR